MEDLLKFIVLLVTITVVNLPCNGCATSQASLLGILTDTSVEEAAQFLEDYSRVEDCYKTYDVTYIDENGVSHSTSATIRYDCEEE